MGFQESRQLVFVMCSRGQDVSALGVDDGHPPLSRGDLIAHDLVVGVGRRQVRDYAGVEEMDDRAAD